MKKHITTVLVVLIFLLGVGLIAYPSFSNWWNDRFQSRAIATYQETVDGNDSAANEQILAAADAYNERVRTDRENGSLLLGELTDEQTEEYNSLLDITGTGIMGYVRIPKINVRLPIYHGTDDAVLQIAVGHIVGSSLPVGGKGTHAVISGHTGLPSAELLTNLDTLGVGDVFIITCLDRKITYEVDQILTVLPNEVSSLEIDPEEDYCTLVTCTPYGINSHRLLVRGHRIDNLVEEDIETIQVEIPERELSTQERIQQFLPYVLILAAGFFGLALIIPSRRKRDEEAEAWEKRTEAREQERRARYRARGIRWEDEGRPSSGRRRAGRERDRRDAYDDRDERETDWEDDYESPRPSRYDRYDPDEERYSSRVSRRDYDEDRYDGPDDYEDDVEFYDEDDGFYDE